MKLRTKSLLIIGGTLAGLLLIVYITSRFIILGSYNDLENENIRMNVGRALNALDNELAELDAGNWDEASWNDTYTFIADRNKDYIQENLTDLAFSNRKLNLMLFVNSSGEIVFSKAFDLDKQKEIPLSQDLLVHFTGTSPVLRYTRNWRHGKTGLISLPEGPMLISARPILTSQDEGPVRGTLVVGRYLSPVEIDRLSKMTSLSLQMLKASDPLLSPDFRTARASLLSGESIFVQKLSFRKAAGYALLKDIYGKPALLLRAEMPREIYNHGRATFIYFIGVMAAVGLVFGVVVTLLLKNVVISRLAKLEAGVRRIGDKGAINERVEMSGKDELGNLAHEINAMLEALEVFHNRLEQAKETAETLSVALKNELEKGWRLQQDFLPQSLPQPPGWELVALLYPARDVSGDFYDAFTVPGGQVALVIGDVCDKGVGSAFFMALYRSLIRIFCAQTEQPQADSSVYVNPLNAVRFANDYITKHHSETNIFITLFFAVLDTDTGLLSYINAGHEPPTILGPAGVKARLSPNSPAVGVIPDIDFDIGQVCLDAGDILIAYTDGVTEARNLDGKFFTEKQLLALMEQSAPSAIALLDRLEGSVRAHMGNAVQFDDITMLAVQRVSVEASETLAALSTGVSPTRTGDRVVASDDANGDFVLSKPFKELGGLRNTCQMINDHVGVNQVRHS